MTPHIYLSGGRAASCICQSFKGMLHLIASLIRVKYNRRWCVSVEGGEGNNNCSHQLSLVGIVFRFIILFQHDNGGRRDPVFAGLPVSQYTLVIDPESITKCLLKFLAINTWIIIDHRQDELTRDYAIIGRGVAEIAFISSHYN